MKKNTWIYLSIYLIFSFSCVDAQLPKETLKQQEQIIIREEQRQKELRKQFQNNTPPTPLPIVPESTKHQTANVQFVFTKIIVEGISLLTSQEVQEITLPFEHRLITFEEINLILRSITNAYVAKGYVTARVYLKPQDLKAGVLKLCVIEGRVRSLAIRQDQSTLPHRGHVMPMQKGDFLNLRDLEQGIDQINRLQSYEATMALEPGEQEGTTDIIIVANQGRPFFVSASGDNYGAKNTGEHQIEFQSTIEDFFNLYDSWTITVRRDSDFEEDDHYSRSLSLNASIPIGYWTLRYSGTLFDYLSTIHGQLQDFKFSGNSQTHRGEIEHIIHRDGQGKTGLAFHMTYKENRNYIESALLKVGNYKRAVAGLRLFHTRRFLGGVLNMAASYHQGLRLLDARKDSEKKPGQTNLQFSKINSDLGYLKPFKIAAQDLSFSTQGTVQHSPDTLVSSERLSFGGPQTVRGFQDTSLNGNTGLYWRNELAWVVLNPQSEPLRSFFGQMQSFIGFDYGWLRKHKKDAFERGILNSICAGVRLQDGFVIGETIVSKSLARPSFLKDEGILLHFKFGIKF